MNPKTWSREELLVEMQKLRATAGKDIEELMELLSTYDRSLREMKRVIAKKVKFMKGKYQEQNETIAKLKVMLKEEGKRKREVSKLHRGSNDG